MSYTSITTCWVSARVSSRPGNFHPRSLFHPCMCTFTFNIFLYFYILNIIAKYFFPLQKSWVIPREWHADHPPQNLPNWVSVLKHMQKINFRLFLIFHVLQNFHFKFLRLFNFWTPILMNIFFAYVSEDSKKMNLKKLAEKNVNKFFFSKICFFQELFFLELSETYAKLYAIFFAYVSNDSKKEWL